MYDPSNNVLNPGGNWTYVPKPLVEHQPISLLIINARLAHTEERHSSILWRIECRGGRVAKVSPMSEPFQRSSMNVDKNSFLTLDAEGGLLLPALCHSHIHLDKCFILEECGELAQGDFQEALSITAQVKANFIHYKEDLYVRGYRLIRDSVAAGVTCMRVHVEVDQIVGSACLETAVRLKETFKRTCDIQISVFAQEPLFDNDSAEIPGDNYDLLERACDYYKQVQCVGSAPYVERTPLQARQNIALILKLASRFNLHADFHLDYNLDPNSEPLIYEVLNAIKRDLDYWRSQFFPRDVPWQAWDEKEQMWGPKIRPRVTIGHATRLQLFTKAQWKDMLRLIGDLPVSFVSLPQSDMYMMGRDEGELNRLGAPRGTLNVPRLNRDYGLKIAMGVNNVQNAFTPQGSPDPLSLVPFGAAVFQCVASQDLRTLVRSVTLTSKVAVGGIDVHLGLFPTALDPADFFILHGSSTLQQAALNPSYDRTTIRAGVIVAKRRAPVWTSADVPDAATQLMELPPALPEQAQPQHKRKPSKKWKEWLFAKSSKDERTLAEQSFQAFDAKFSPQPMIIRLGPHDKAWDAAQRFRAPPVHPPRKGEVTGKTLYDASYVARTEIVDSAIG